jgi:hypothetical protein
MSCILATVFSGRKDTVKCTQSGVVKTSKACIGELQTSEEKVCVHVCVYACVSACVVRNSLLWVHPVEC